jgi:isopenicillin-N epimerase
LYEEYKIEIPLMRQGADVYLRYSIQAFNTRENLEYLLETLKALRGKGELIQ